MSQKRVPIFHRKEESMEDRCKGHRKSTNPKQRPRPVPRPWDRPDLHRHTALRRVSCNYLLYPLPLKLHGEGIIMPILQRRQACLREINRGSCVRRPGRILFRGGSDRPWLLGLYHVTRPGHTAGQRQIWYKSRSPRYRAPRTKICINDGGFRFLEVHLCNLGYEVMIFTKKNVFWATK